MSGPVRDLVGALCLVLGLIAISLGLWLVNLSAQGERDAGAFGQGLTFMVAGAQAVNFPAFIGVMERLLVMPSAGI